MERGDRPKCLRCDSTNVYVLRNGDIVCRACGQVTKGSDIIYNAIREDKKEEGVV